jgi:hypothetical protein
VFTYEFNGGVDQPNIQNTVKFLLFFVVGGQEIPQYQMVQNGQVTSGLADAVTMDRYSRVVLAKPCYTTKHNVVKLFVRSSGDNLPNRFFSFYFRLAGQGAPEVTIKPFPGCQMFNYYFKARGNFLTKNQALGLLSKDCPSRMYLKRQEMLSKETLRSMIKIDRSAEREGIRHLRIGKRRKGGQG